MVKVKKLTETATMPTYGSNEAACFDLYLDCPDVVCEIPTIYMEEDDSFICKNQVGAICIPPHGTVKAHTGLAFQPPEGYMLQILQRSGLASKGIIPIGGIVDNDYRGEVMVIMLNTTDYPYVISHGDKIAQMALRRYYQADLTEVDELDKTDRGGNGFGSTGK